MANVYMGSNVEEFIFDESATFEENLEEGCSKKEGSEEPEKDADLEEAYAELDQCGVIECTDEPEVACYRIALENEMNYNSIMNYFMESEMSVLESTGTEMVYEAADVSKFFASVKKLVEKFWAKIQGVFKAIVTRIGTTVTSNKGFVKKYKGAKVAIPSGKEFKGYNFTDKVPGFSSVKTTITNMVSNKYIKFIGAVKDNDQAEGYVKEFNDSFDSFKAHARGAMCGDMSKTVEDKEFNKALKIAFYGSEEKVALKNIPFASLITELESGKDAQKKAKASYKDAKTAVAGLKAEIKKAEKDLKGTDHKSAGMKIGNCLSKAVNASLNIMSVGMSAYSRAIFTEMVQARSMAMYYINHSEKEIKANKESATEELDGIVLI